MNVIFMGHPVDKRIRAYAVQLTPNHLKLHSSAAAY